MRQCDGTPGTTRNRQLPFAIPSNKPWWSGLSSARSSYRAIPGTQCAPPGALASYVIAPPAAAAAWERYLRCDAPYLSVFSLQFSVLAVHSALTCSLTYVRKWATNRPAPSSQFSPSAFFPICALRVSSLFAVHSTLSTLHSTLYTRKTVPPPISGFVYHEIAKPLVTPASNPQYFILPLSRLPCRGAARCALRHSTLSTLHSTFCTGKSRSSPASAR